ncbi:SdpI family protein [Nocardiopsis terrae]
MTLVAQPAEQTIPLAPLILVMLILSGVAAALVAVGVLGARRRIRPNELVGIRTRYTRSSDAAWYAVHEASARWSVLAGLAFLPAVLLTPLVSDPDGQIVAILGPMSAGTLLLIVGAWRGHRLARERLAREEGRADLP